MIIPVVISFSEGSRSELGGGGGSFSEAGDGAKIVIRERRTLTRGFAAVCLLMWK